jgi:hypothetical protein
MIALAKWIEQVVNKDYISKDLCLLRGKKMTKVKKNFCGVYL